MAATLSEDLIIELFDFLGPGPLLQYAQCSRHLRRSLTHASLPADNELYDSLQGVSDREAPAEPSLKFVASQLVSRA